MVRVGEAIADAAAEAAFWWRSSLRWSLPAWKRNTGTWARWAAWPGNPERHDQAARARGDQLRARFDLARWPRLLAPLELQENLYLLDVLAQHLPDGVPPGPALDIGSKNGVTLPALAAATGRDVTLVELDAHRRYATFATRRAHGERMARQFAGARYLAGSVTSVSGAFAVITWILPFVHEAPLRAWGLPRRFFAPQELLAHALTLLAPGGVLLVVNQGEEEHATQGRLFTEAGVTATNLGVVESPLSPFRRTRLGWRWHDPR